MKRNWFIKVADDYHEFYDYDNEDKGTKYAELGCYAEKECCGYCRYFAVVYKGRMPSFDRVWNSLKKRIALDTEVIHGYTGDDVGITEKEAKAEVRRSMKAYRDE